MKSQLKVQDAITSPTLVSPEQRTSLSTHVFLNVSASPAVDTDTADTEAQQLSHKELGFSRHRFSSMDSPARTIAPQNNQTPLSKGIGLGDVKTSLNTELPGAPDKTRRLSPRRFDFN